MAPRGFQHVLIALAALVWAPVCALGQMPEDVGETPEAINRPTSIGRIVRHFDFEEQRFNALDIPLYWIRAQHDPQVRERPGFPITNLGRLDYTSPTTSGTGSVRLDTTGGSTSLRLQAGVAPTFPSVRYAVGAMVRVEGLDHARPRLAARLLDERGTPIAGASASALVTPDDGGAERGGGGGWAGDFVPVLLTLPAAPANAVSLQIDLELVQPEQFDTRGPGEYRLVAEDYAGTVWFDDVVIVQLPTASLSVTSQSNTFVGQQRPELAVRVRDLSGDPIDLDLRVRDIDGAVVASRTERFGMGSRAFRWTPDLSERGWYEAEMVVRVGATPMLRLREPFVWLPSLGRIAARPQADDGAVPDRVALVALSDRRRLAMLLPPAPTSPLPARAREVFERSGSRSLLASVRVARGSDTDWSDLARWFTAMSARLGVQSTAILEVDLDTSDDDDDADEAGDLALAHLDDEAAWDGLLVPVVDRLAGGVSRWHVGPVGSDALAATPGSDDRLRRVADRLHRLSPDPTIGTPWSGAFNPAAAAPQPASPGDTGAPGARWSLTITAPRDADGPWIEEAAARVRALLEAGRADEGLLVIEPLDEALFGRRAIVARLAEQMLAFWGSLPAQGPPAAAKAPPAEMGLVLAGGFVWRHPPADETPADASPAEAGDATGDGARAEPNRVEPSRIEPSAALAAWRGVGDRLAGRRRVHRFTTADGVRAEVYQPVVARAGDGQRGRGDGEDGGGGGGMLVLHPVDPDPGGPARYFELYLGDHPVRVYDAMGNSEMVAAVEAPEPHAPTPRAVHRIELGDWPVFVEGVDVDLLLFLASLRLEPARLPAIDAEHRVALAMANPWPGVTSVRARVVSPGGLHGRPVSERSWEIAPRLTELLLEGGAQRRTPISIRFRPSEPAGRKNLGLELDIRGEHSVRRVRVDVPFEIGLDYLSVSASALRTPEGVLVLAEVRNLGDRPVSLEATAIAPGARHQRASIARLPAGATARRELLLRGVDAQRVMLAIEDVDVGARLNYEVDVP